MSATVATIAGRQSRAHRARTISALVAAGTVIGWSVISTQAAPWMLIHPDTARALASYLVRIFPPDLSPAFLYEVAIGVVETLAISLAGTGLAVAIGASAALFAARGLLFDRGGYAAEPRTVRAARYTAYTGARLALNVLRTIPEIVWALLFVFAVGLGPFPGVLALALHTGGVLGKLLAELLEDVRTHARESLQSCGASPVAVMAYGVLPEVLPQCIAYSLYRWEVNIRAAAVLGFVGAGGLGQQVHIAISLFLEHRLLTLVVAIYLTIILVDALSLAVRRRWS